MRSRFFLLSFVRWLGHKRKRSRQLSGRWDPHVCRAHRFMGARVCRRHTPTGIEARMRLTTRHESQRPVQDFTPQLIPAICTPLLTSLLCIATLLEGRFALRRADGDAECGGKWRRTDDSTGFCLIPSPNPAGLCPLSSVHINNPTPGWF